jgi:hypothetical protein
MISHQAAVPRSYKYTEHSLCLSHYIYPHNQKHSCSKGLICLK